MKIIENMDVKMIMRKYGMVIVLVLMVILISILRPAFLSPTNIFNLLTQTSIFGIMALGMTFVIISKGIDLSVGAVLAFSGLVAASLAQVEAPMKLYPNLPALPFIIPVLVGLGVGAGCGAVNGFLVAKTKIPAFIATLGMMTITRGFCLLYTNARPLSNLTPEMNLIGAKVFNMLPVPVIIYFIVIVISYVLLNKTRFGKSTYAIGGNITAAEVSGINVSKNTVMIYAYCGLLAGLAALVFAGRVGSVHPGAAEGYELTAIAATTIGGTSQSGGIGTIGGAFVGAMVLAVMRNGFTLLGVNAYWQKIAEGAIIVGAVILDMRKNAKKA
ncbi:MAG: ABC transporter permease [Treponema sp.]|jgi:inositol transport system permease protein|nr:ABC transporter permease [Treponema sp.]